MKKEKRRIMKKSRLFVLLLFLWCILASCAPDFEAFAQKEGLQERIRQEDSETEEDAICPGEIYVEEPAQAVQMRDVLIGDTQKTIYNPGGADLTDVLGVERADVLNWLGQHVNDDYYLGTPYVPNDWRSPNGDPSFNGTPGMNCTGFVWHVLRQAGANENTPGLKGWVSLIANNRMEYVTYTGSNWNDVSASVAWDEICEPGDVIWTWDMTKGALRDGLSYHISPKHHVSFFIGTYFDGIKSPGNSYWQEGEVFDRIWHSSDDNASGAQGVGNVATWMVPKEWTGPYAITVLKMKDRKGSLELQKTSALPMLTEKNSCYSLEGAEYGIYSGDTQIATMTTDQNGYARAENLPVGTYQVKELKVPRGYAMNPQAYEVNIRSGETAWVEVQDIPQSNPVELLLNKVDKETGQPAPQGNSSLENAEFTVKYYDIQSDQDPALQGKTPIRSWILRTDKEGVVKLSDAYKVSGDDFYHTAAGNYALPLGTVTIQETKAPVGYLLNSEVFVRKIISDGNAEEVHTYHPPTVSEVPQKGRIELQKVDSETAQNQPQGEAVLKGAVYDIFLKSAYRTGDGTESASYKGSLTTNDNGKAGSKELPLDIYYVIERRPGTGYLIDTKIHEVTLSADNKTDKVFTKEVKSKEEIVRGNVEIIKLKEIENKDDDTFEGLEGVEFTFTSDTTGKVVKRIVTDENGFATTAEKGNPRGGLVYGTYTVTETKYPEGLKPIEPFKVTIREEGVTLKGIYKEDKLIVSPITVVKVDKSTGKTIPIAGVEFRLLDKDKKPIKMTTYYPDKVVHKTFKTDQNGQFTFPDKLKYGTYCLEEVKAPEGYLKGELLEFKVTEGAIWENALSVKYEDENAMGQIKITKCSEEDETRLKGAVFEIRAAEDIMTPDGTFRMKKGDLADTITTDTEGTATSKKLYLGKYEVKEIKQPDGYILNEKSVTAELKYKDQMTEVVTEELTVTNKPTEIVVLKLDAETEKPMKGVSFKIWNKDMAPDTAINPENNINRETGAGQDTGESADTDVDTDMGVTEEYRTDKHGKITLKHLMPGTYCVQETKSQPGYIMKDKVYEITIDKNGKTGGEDVGKIIVENDFTKVELSKHDLSTGKEIQGGEYQVLDKKGNVINQWKGEKTPHRIERLEAGETYTFSEISAPKGYLLAADVEFTVEASGKVQKVKMYDELAMGTITIEKCNSETKDKITGAHFEIYAAKDIVTPDGTVRLKRGELADSIQTEGGKATTKPLFMGEYEVVESKAAPGYIRGEKKYSVTLKYKDQNTAVVTETVYIENTPIPPQKDTPDIPEEKPNEPLQPKEEPIPPKEEPVQPKEDGAVQTGDTESFLLWIVLAVGSTVILLWIRYRIYQTKKPRRRR